MSKSMLGMMSAMLMLVGSGCSMSHSEAVDASTPWRESSVRTPKHSSVRSYAHARSPLAGTPGRSVGERTDGARMDARLHFPLSL